MSELKPSVSLAILEVFAICIHCGNTLMLQEIHYKLFVPTTYCPGCHLLCDLVDEAIALENLLGYHSPINLVVGIFIYQH